MAGLARGLLGLLIGVGFCCGAACIEAGLPIECAQVEDCAGKAPTCQIATACAQGVCVFDDTPEGTPTAEQTPGDCLQAVCDEAGKVKMVPLDADPPDDGNVCTLDTCVGVTPTHTAQAEVACDTGLKGICAVGVQKCEAEGLPVPGCVAPEPNVEWCDAGQLDEDCDGLVNEEGVNCVCGDGYVSKGEECDDGGTMDGDNCTASCKGQKVLQMTVGYEHTCALLNGGSIKCWGHNSDGQLGLGDTANRGDGPSEMGDSLPKIDLGTGRTTQTIAAGVDHTCARLDDGSVKCWGRNDFGQLGLGDKVSRGSGPNQMGNSLPKVDLGTGRTAKAIAAGSDHTCARLDDSSVKCWGYNIFGQLGLGDNVSRGEGPNQLGNNLPKVDLGTGRTAQAIAVGYEHTCALLDDGSVKCWGRNYSGQLGLGDTTDHGSGPSQMGNNLPKVDLGTGRTAQAIAAGLIHTCALLDDGSVKCWGYNSYGQLGLGDTDNRGDGPNQMGNNLPKIDLGTGRTAQAIAVGANHTCARLDDDSIKCWGRNDFGELGLGDKVSLGGGPNQLGNNLPKIDLGTGRTAQTLAAGVGHTCALLDDGSVKCWGYNDFGQLGQGDILWRGDDPGEMGDKLPTVKLYSDTW